VKQRIKLLAISGTLLGLSAAAMGCGGGSSSASASAPAVTVTAAPATPGFDTETITACKEADASSGGGLGNDGYSRTLLAAKLSDVATLRDIEAKVGEAAYSQAAIDQLHTMTAVIEINTWCLGHKVLH
jgi:ABC-type glycerol-3-phosphate transport system substrate-binding protein